MTEEQKMKLIADLLEEEVEDLNAECILEELENWDSVAVMSLLALLKKNGFNKKLDSEAIEQLKTIQDLLDLMM